MSGHTNNLSLYWEEGRNQGKISGWISTSHPKIACPKVKILKTFRLIRKKGQFGAQLLYFTIELIIWERSEKASSKIQGFQTSSPVRHLPSLLQDPPR